jgi:peptide-methionine (S)-S-oxide reductase
MIETAIFGGGCFWCTEAIFKSLKGVISVTPGYAGGRLTNPTYEKVGTGETGHAEVVKIGFDPQIISYETLLEIFFTMHYPTILNRQGADTGTQYRSIILYINKNQKEMAEKAKKKINRAVTEIKELDKFYPAEDYHINYYEKNTDYPYCRLVISPKLNKLRKEFSKLMAISE